MSDRPANPRQQSATSHRAKSTTDSRRQASAATHSPAAANPASAATTAPALPAAARNAYNKTRVYHATHSEAAESIKRDGLAPQGSTGLSGLIGDTTRAQGHVFFTTDKQQAATYAKGVAGIEKQRQLIAARQAGDIDKEDDIMTEPPRPRLLRAIVSPATQAQASQDEKGGNGDYMLKASIPAGNILPGSESKAADLRDKAQAVDTFHNALTGEGMETTRENAATLLQRARANSIEGDQRVLNDPDVTKTSDSYIGTFKMNNPMPF